MCRHGRYSASPRPSCHCGHVRQPSAPHPPPRSASRSPAPVSRMRHAPRLDRSAGRPSAPRPRPPQRDGGVAQPRSRSRPPAARPSPAIERQGSCPPCPGSPPAPAQGWRSSVRPLSPSTMRHARQRLAQGRRSSVRPHAFARRRPALRGSRSRVRPLGPRPCASRPPAPRQTALRGSPKPAVEPQRAVLCRLSRFRPWEPRPRAAVEPHRAALRRRSTVCPRPPSPEPPSSPTGLRWAATRPSAHVGLTPSRRRAPQGLRAGHIHKSKCLPFSPPALYDTADSPQLLAFKVTSAYSITSNIL